MDDTQQAAVLADTIAPAADTIEVSTLLAGTATDTMALPASMMDLLPTQGSAFVDLPVQQPSVGRIVRYRLPADHPRGGEERPAAITRVVAGMKVNLAVFLDGPNDGAPIAPIMWAGTVDYSEEPAPRTWAWPVRV